MDYFVTQRRWMLLIGIWPPITKPNVAQLLLSFAHRLFQLFLFLVMSHFTVTFSVSFYLAKDSGSFARISYCLSQIIIYSFASFVVFYLNWQAAGIKAMIDFMNHHFRYRSAPGNFDIMFHRICSLMFFVTSKGLTYVKVNTTFTGRLMTGYVNIASLSTLQWAVYPFFREERSLPLACWYPFDALVSFFKGSQTQYLIYICIPRLPLCTRLSSLFKLLHSGSYHLYFAYRLDSFLVSPS